MDSSEQGDAPEQAFRAAGEALEFWNFGPNEPANGEVDLGDDDDDDGLPDTIIWCIGGDGEGSDVFDPDTYELLLFTDENQIFDAAGTLQCTAYFEDGLFKLRQGLDGPVLLTTTPGRYVFDGDVPGGLPQPGTPAWQQLIYGQLVYEYFGTLVYDGPRWQADIVATATEKLNRANPMRRLLVAALYDGICGTPDPTPPPG